MLTVEKLKAMQPWEIFAQGEWIDDWKIFNIWWEWWHVQWVAVRGKWHHDRAIYYHLSNEEERDKAETDADFYYCCKWNWESIANVWDKLTRESTIKALVPCDDEAFNLYRY